MKEKIEQSRRELAIATQRLKGLSPMERLQAGYAFVTTSSNCIVKEVKQVAIGEELQIEVTDGTIVATISKIEERQV